jgi:type IV secretory pathway VirD2 relaxase
MTATSFDRLLKSSRLAMPATGADDFRADRSIRMTRPGRERLEGKIKGGRAKSSGGAPAKAPSLSSKMDKRASARAFDGDASGAGMAFDARQRAIVKVHYFNHAGGGGSALKAHVRYVARDAATRDDLQPPSEGKAADREAQARAHAAYLSREGAAERSVFYDAKAEGVDGAARAEAWARADKRHFRIVLSAENGARLHDLPAYTREVMARAEAALGSKLQWVAVDHHDAGNPHTHLIIRGRRGNGQDLVLPRDFIKYGFASIARDVATESLGPRSPADERLALARDVGRHAPTRLDRMIAALLPENGTVRIASLEAPNGDPPTTLALKARARELQRMGLAQEVKRNVLAFTPDWRDRLQAMELHLDIRKRVVQQRVLQQQVSLEQSLKQLTRGLLGR